MSQRCRQKEKGILLNRQSLRFLVGLEELPQEQGQRRKGKDQTDGIRSAREGAAELPDDEGDHPGKAALIADGKPGPFRAVHLALDGADGRKAGRAEQVEDHEGVGGKPAVSAGDGVEVLGNAIPDLVAVLLQLFLAVLVVIGIHDAEVA